MGRFGVEGTRADRTRLETAGFQFAQDIQDDRYYVLPEGGHILHLFDNGTWSSDKAGEHQSLEEYLHRIEKLRAETAVLYRRV
jgi:hypothetical protein